MIVYIIRYICDGCGARDGWETRTRRTADRSARHVGWKLGKRQRCPQCARKDVECVVVEYTHKKREVFRGTSAECVVEMSRRRHADKEARPRSRKRISWGVMSVSEWKKEQAR